MIRGILGAAGEVTGAMGFSTGAAGRVGGLVGLWAMPAGRYPSSGRGDSIGRTSSGRSGAANFVGLK